MKRLLRPLIYPALAIAALVFAHVAHAEGYASKPLVVIRFNQLQVYYEQSLYEAVSKAVAVKPTVMLSVVSAAPSTGNQANDLAWQQNASAHTQQVVASLQNMGVPLSRMNISGQRENGLRYDEVRVYVR